MNFLCGRLLTWAILRERLSPIDKIRFVLTPISWWYSGTANSIWFMMENRSPMILPHTQVLSLTWSQQAQSVLTSIDFLKKKYRSCSLYWISQVNSYQLRRTAIMTATNTTIFRFVISLTSNYSHKRSATASYKICKLFTFFSKAKSQCNKPNSFNYSKVSTHHT